MNEEKLPRKILRMRAKELMDQQVCEDDPPALRRAMARLIFGGMSTEEAYREILKLIVGELERVSVSGVFDQQGYVRALDMLSKGAPEDPREILGKPKTSWHRRHAGRK